MQLEIVGRTLVAHIDGDLDHHCATNIRRELDKILKRSEIKNLILDFSGLDFMDSSGIGVIIGRYKLINQIGGKTAVVVTKPNVNRMLTASGLKKIVSSYKTVSDALKGLKEVKA